MEVHCPQEYNFINLESRDSWDTEKAYSRKRKTGNALKVLSDHDLSLIYCQKSIDNVYVKKNSTQLPPRTKQWTAIFKWISSSQTSLHPFIIHLNWRLDSKDPYVQLVCREGDEKNWSTGRISNLRTDVDRSIHEQHQWQFQDADLSPGSFLADLPGT